MAFFFNDNMIYFEGYSRKSRKINVCVSQCPTVGPKDPNVRKEYKINLYACKPTPQ